MTGHIRWLHNYEERLWPLEQRNGERRRTMKNRGLGMSEIMLILIVLIILGLADRSPLVRFISDVIPGVKGGKA